MSQITLTLGQFLTLSETQAKILVSQGYEIVIGSETSNPTVAKATEQSKVVVPTTPKSTKKVVNNNTSSTAKSSAKTSKKGETTKLSVTDYKTAFVKYLLQEGKITEKQFNNAKGDIEKIAKLYKKFSKSVKFNNSKAVEVLSGVKTPSKEQPKSPKETSKEPAFGKVKVGDFFKVYFIDVKTKKAGDIIAVGVAKSINKTDKTITAKGGKQYAIENCVAINEVTYNKLKKSLNKSKSNNQTPAPKNIDVLPYTLVIALKARDINPDVNYINDVVKIGTTLSSDNISDTDKNNCYEQLMNIRKNVASRIPDWKTINYDEAVVIIKKHQNEYRVFNDMKF